MIITIIIQPQIPNNLNSNTNTFLNNNNGGGNNNNNGGQSNQYYRNGRLKRGVYQLFNNTYSNSCGGSMRRYVVCNKNKTQ